jgi:hypothetical protein
MPKDRYHEEFQPLEERDWKTAARGCARIRVSRKEGMLVLGCLSGVLDRLFLLV